MSTLKLDPIADVVANTSFTITGTYTPDLLQCSYIDDSGATVSFAGPTTQVTAAISFQHTGLATAGNHTVHVHVGNATADGVVVVKAPASSVVYIQPGQGSFNNQGHRYTLTTTFRAQEDAKDIPGGSGTSQMALASSTTYGQDQASGNWYTWDTQNWNGPVAPPNGGGVVPPDPIPPSGNATRDGILAWLHGLVGKAVIPGQYIDPVVWEDAIERFHSQTGDDVAMVGTAYWPDWDSTAHAPPTIANPNALYKSHWAKGGLVCHNGFLPSPAGGGGTLYPAGINAQDCITKGTAQYQALFHSYDQEIAGLKELQDSGVVVLFRPFLENRWASFWWGVPAHFTPQQFAVMWQQRYDYYRSQGLTNLIWVLSQYVAESYPGDDYVQCHGEDCYSNTISAYKSYYDSEIAAHPQLTWSATEWGSGDPTNAGSVDLNAFVEDLRTQMPKCLWYQTWRPNWALWQQKNQAGMVANPYCLPLSRLRRPS